MSERAPISRVQPSSLAWVVSVLYHDRTPTAETVRVVYVLCPVCGSVHQHGSDPVLAQLGDRSPHCVGEHRELAGFEDYDLVWPDDASAQYLADQRSICHAVLRTGRQCSRHIGASNLRGYYCGDQLHPDSERRWGTVAVDVSGLSAGADESMYTPKFSLVRDENSSAVRFTEAQLRAWEEVRLLDAVD